MCNVACDGILKVEIEISGDFGCLTKGLAIAEHGGLRARLLPLSAVARSPARVSVPLRRRPLTTMSRLVFSILLALVAVCAAQGIVVDFVGARRGRE